MLMRVYDEQGKFIGVLGEAGFVYPGQSLSDGEQVSAIIIIVTDQKLNRYDFSTKEQFTDWLDKATSTGAWQHDYKLGNITIDGMLAVQYIDDALYGDRAYPYYTVVTWLRYRDNNYYIEFSWPPSEEDINVYNEILSTFKFIK